jgi:GNAT superfamily N-acetyltransferase
MGIISTVFNGTVYLQASLKAFELDSRTLEDKYGLLAKKIDYDSDVDLETWMSIIHTSYDDCIFTVDTARQYLANHRFMKDTQTYLFYETRSGKPVATVSFGLYITNPKVGGDFRIGVTQSSQGKGYGRLCILFAFSQLAAMGVKYGESAILFKRKESLYLHYSLGFKPQPNLRFVANRTVEKKIKNLNFILKFRLRMSYRDYLKKERKHFRI